MTDYLRARMTKLKKGDFLHHLEITDATNEGKGLAKLEGKIVFVENAVPGDIVSAKVFYDKKNFVEARAVEIEKSSPYRIDPVCKHFGVCGGCKWQNLQYEKQLEYKQRWVEDNFTRIGKIPLPTVTPILVSENIYQFRNRLDFGFSHQRWLTNDEINSENKAGPALGFHVPGRFDKILDIENCHLQPSPSNEIRNAVRKFALENNYTFFNLRNQEGFLRSLIIRNTMAGNFMVIMIFFYEDAEKRIALLEYIKQNFPAVTSLLYIINEKKNETIFDQQVNVYAGSDHIIEEMEGLRFKISAKSFYQTNPGQAYQLYKIARDFAALQQHELVYDLYTGTGTIAQFIAKQCKHVIGVEQIEDAIEDAKLNTKANDISNTTFIAGDLAKTLNDDFVQQHGRPDVIITDPPRAGMHESVVRKITELLPQRIVYVSCNAATQARDIALMLEHYRVTRMQPVDMFPQTTHVENVALLERI